MSSSGNTPLVLLVDDDATTRLIAEATLSAAGYRVESVDSGEAAVAALEAQTPNVVVLDVQLPGMSGIDVCRHIRSAFERRIPIIMLTGDGDGDTVERSYSAGATDFVVKPVHWPSLSHRVAHVLRAQRTDDALAAQRKRTDMIFGALPDDFLLVDMDGYTRDAFDGGRFGLSPRITNSRQHLQDFFPQEQSAVVADAIAEMKSTGNPVSAEIKVERSRCVVELRIVPQSDELAVAVLRDVTERHEAAARIHELAYLDSVTGLPNRALFLRELRRCMRIAERNGEMCALLNIDLDRFKRINDSLGHSVGDALLRSVAQRLEKCIRPSDYLAKGGAADEPTEEHQRIARLGGDEFVILVNAVNVRSAVEVVATRVREALQAPFRYQGRQFVLTPSIGVVVYPQDGSDVDVLLTRADTAMYDAKRAGRNTLRFYDPEMDASALERLWLEEDLRDALGSDQLSLHYQPKVCLATGEINGAEALLRWQHPERGAISPATFIPVAEDTGLIFELGNWVVQHACRQLREWQDAGVDFGPLSINVSAEQFERVDVADQILRALWENGVRPAKLIVEITENLLMQDSADVRARLNTLRDAGVAIAMDDFGTGYSSLAYLQKFPLDALKIDRSFVMNLERNTSSAEICGAIIAMARKLGLRVVAEGIEEVAQYELLAEAGCDQGQGFLFSRPIPAPAFAELVATPRDVVSWTGTR
ncbi:MAG: EAL domain-containing protein [Pseudomonadota bacterium]